MQNKRSRPRVPKGVSLIVTVFDITMKLTQQVSKNCRQKRKGQKNAYHLQRPGRTSKICSDTFRPVNVIKSDLRRFPYLLF